MSSMLVGLFVTMTLGVMLVMFITNIINLLWTCIMTSYSISLPGLIWGGGAFNFPDFIPRSANSPMNYYYWFFVVAVIIIVVCFAINAFRHLAVWGKFDENQSYEGTNFWHQFKWVLILIFMTILTPVVIWICYSILMLGVYFFVNLAGNNVMFLTISQDQYASLKTQVLDDLSKIANMNPTMVQDFVKGLINGKSDEAMIDIIMSVIGETATSQQAAQILQNLKILASSESVSKIKELQQCCSKMWWSVYLGTFVSPLSTSTLDSFYTSMTSILNEANIGTTPIPMSWHGTTLYVTEFSFIKSWEYIFGSWTPDTKFNIEKLAKFVHGESIPSIVSDWKSGTGIFSIMGYGATETAMSNWLINNKVAYATPSVYKVMGLGTYTAEKGEFDIYFLTFVKGEETGVKTCPLVRYIMGIFGTTSTASWHFYKVLILNKLTAASGGLVCVIIGEIMEKFIVLGESTGTPTAIALETTGLALFFASSITLFIQVIIFIAASKMLLNPLLGIVIFLWSSFFEAMWYFFLLLPAIGASVLDNGQKIYMTTWKHCLGKMAASLVTWAALLMFFVGILQINNFYTSIINGIKGSSDSWSDVIDISILLPNLSLFEKIGLGLTSLVAISIQLSISGIIKFLLAIICLNASIELIQKIGSLAFGQEVYGGVAQKIGQPLNAIAPGFSQAVASVVQAGKQYATAGLKAGQKMSDMRGSAVRGEQQMKTRQKEAAQQVLADNKAELLSKQKEYQSELDSGTLTKKQQAVVQTKLNNIDTDLKKMAINEQFLDAYGYLPNGPTGDLSELQSEQLKVAEAASVGKKYIVSQDVIQRDLDKQELKNKELLAKYKDCEDI